jgi:hypothetical protein
MRIMSGPASKIVVLNEPPPDTKGCFLQPRRRTRASQPCIDVAQHQVSQLCSSGRQAGSNRTTLEVSMGWRQLTEWRWGVATSAGQVGGAKVCSWTGVQAGSLLAHIHSSQVASSTRAR